MRANAQTFKLRPYTIYPIPYSSDSPDLIPYSFLEFDKQE